MAQKPRCTDCGQFISPGSKHGHARREAPDEAALRRKAGRLIPRRPRRWGHRRRGG